MTIRPFRESDRDALHRLTVECFGNSMHVTVDEVFGPPKGIGWQSRKIADVNADCEANADGVFVAEEDGEVVGFITTRLDPATGIGHIANLAVGLAQQGRGIGSALLRTALASLSAQGMTHARIETLERNVVGRHLYPKVGFREIARQIYYMTKIGTEEISEEPRNSGVPRKSPPSPF